MVFTTSQRTGIARIAGLNAIAVMVTGSKTFDTHNDHTYKDNAAGPLSQAPVTFQYLQNVMYECAICPTMTQSPNSYSIAALCVCDESINDVNEF
ncbi:MAG: hypothetical protein EZS28_049034, partial [Streblomastix strix]